MPSGPRLSRSLSVVLLLTAPAALSAAPAAVPPAAAPFRGAPAAEKEAAVAAVERQAADLTGLADQIWGFAETALKETRSSKVLADYAERQGFKVERGVAGMPTAFVASFGEGRPILGILG